MIFKDKIIRGLKDKNTQQRLIRKSEIFSRKFSTLAHSLNIQINMLNYY